MTKVDISSEAVERLAQAISKHGQCVNLDAAATLRAQAERIRELEAALQWQADTIRKNITENDLGKHRLLLDGVYHEGPVVDWTHQVLTGLEKISLALIEGDKT